MLIGKAISPNNIPIRLTKERWLHIVTSHQEIDSSEASKILDAVENPDEIRDGDFGEFLAVKKKSGMRVFYVVVYKEVTKTDGFILTAYITSDKRWLGKRKLLWTKHS